MTLPAYNKADPLAAGLLTHVYTNNENHPRKAMRCENLQVGIITVGHHRPCPNQAIVRESRSSRQIHH